MPCAVTEVMTHELNDTHGDQCNGAERLHLFGAEEVSTSATGNPACTLSAIANTRRACTSAILQKIISCQAMLC